MANSIYTDRRFIDMPILADVLEKAGCTDVAVLQHCREPRELDLLLGKP